MIKKKTLTYVMTGALTVGILGAIPAFAAEEEKALSSQETVFGHGKGHGKFQFNENQLKEKASELGIDTEGKNHHAIMEEIHRVRIEAKAKELGISSEGKDGDQLAQEVRETLVKQKAKELGIKTEGKEFDDLFEQVIEAVLIKEARELGIVTEGKDHHELKREVMDASILKAAKELDINTEGKSTKELVKEIMTDHREEAKKLDNFPFNKEERFLFHGGKRGHHGHGNEKGRRGDHSGLNADRSD
ncbi:MAG: hypothetical protein ACQEUT_14545 [Bacillota bacterium]